MPRVSSQQRSKRQSAAPGQPGLSPALNHLLCFTVLGGILFAPEPHFLPSLSSTFLRLLPTDLTADLTSALLAPVFPAAYFTS